MMIMIFGMNLQFGRFYWKQIIRHEPLKSIGSESPLRAAFPTDSMAIQSSMGLIPRRLRRRYQVLQAKSKKQEQVFLRTNCWI